MDDEAHNPFTLKHIGIVADNNDPEKRKRLRVEIEPWHYLEKDQLPWVKQEGDGSVGCSPNESSHHIPEIGSEVTVYFKNNDPNDPVYTGVETTEANRCTLFDEGYPNSYGNKDSVGNYEIVNKDSKTTVRQYASGTIVRAEEDGTYEISTAAGDYIRIDGNGEVWNKKKKIHICAEDDLELRGTRIKMVASNQLDMSAGNKVTITGTNGVEVNGGVTTLQAKSGILLRGMVTADDLSVNTGSSGQTIDVMNPGNILTFHNGNIETHSFF